MKIYIVGSVASGKSTLARRMSRITRIPCYHLDEVVYMPASGESWGNMKRPIEERNALFYDILSQDNYIIEDAGRDCFIDGMRQADIIVLLEIPLIVRQKRILFRWIKQNLGIEKCIYYPKFEVLQTMFRWAKEYDYDIDNAKEHSAAFQNKRIILKNQKDIKVYLKQIEAASAKRYRP